MEQTKKTPLYFFRADEKRAKFKKLRLIFATLLVVALLAGLILPSLAAIEIIAFDALAIALITLPFVIAFAIITKSVHKKYLENTEIFNINSNTATDDKKIITEINNWQYNKSNTTTEQQFYIDKIANICTDEEYATDAHALTAYNSISQKTKGLEITSDSIEKYINNHKNN